MQHLRIDGAQKKTMRHYPNGRGSVKCACRAREQSVGSEWTGYFFAAPNVWLLQKKQTAFASRLEFREADRIGPDNVLDLRCGAIAGLQQDDFRRRAEGQAEIDEVLVLGQEDEPVRSGELPNSGIGRTAEPHCRDVNRPWKQVGELSGEFRCEVLVNE